MKKLLRGFFDIISKVQSDKYLVFYCLVQLDGILDKVAFYCDLTLGLSMKDFVLREKTLS